jgi:hypothetical protein
MLKQVEPNSYHYVLWSFWPDTQVSEEFADKGLYSKDMLFPVTAHLRPITMLVEHMVAELVEAIRYQLEGHGFDS